MRPCSSVGSGIMVDLIRRSWFRFPPRSKDFFFVSCGSLFPLLGLTPSGLFMGLSSTLIYTSELILCFTIRELVIEAFRGIVPDLARVLGVAELLLPLMPVFGIVLFYVTVAGLVFPPKMAMLKILSLPVCLFLRL